MPRRRPSKAYSRFFSTLFAGLLFLIAGAAGYHLDHRTPLLTDSRWADGPLLWEMAWGVGFLALSAFFYRRLPPGPATATPFRQRVMKYAGHGRTAAARRGQIELPK